MYIRRLLSFSFMIAILALVAIACRGVPASPAPVAPAGGGDQTPPAVTSSVIEGEVLFENVASSFADAIVYVRLEDVSRADAPAVTVAEETIPNVSVEAGESGTLRYSLTHPLLEDRKSYALRVHVDVDRSGRQITAGDYVTTTRYSVPPSGTVAPINVVVELVPGETPSVAIPPEEAVPTVATVTGTVTYLERIALTPDAIVEVKLVDVSRADAPAVTLGEQTIENPGQVPVTFEIKYDPSEIDERFTYAVQARITESGNLTFINTSAYQVLTRGNPSHVDLTLEKVGSSAPPAPSTPDMVSVPAPVEQVGVVVSASAPYEYLLVVMSRLPRGSSCSEFEGFKVARNENTVDVTVTNLEVAEQNVPCTRDLPVVETEIPLGSDFTPGETYEVVVNGQLTNSFVARDPEGREMVRKTSPIESVEVVAGEADPSQYSLVVISRLPMGSSCSAFDGYEIARWFANTINITVNHLEITAQNALCTADLPVVETEIPLGRGFVPGETYEIVVNGQLTNSFVARDPEGREMVKKTSPIESVEIVAGESTPRQYSVVVISRLPKGSSCSAFDGYEVARRFANTIHITVSHLEVTAQNVPCTADLPVVKTEIPLGGGFTPGETYEVLVNDEVTETFVAN